MLPWCGPISHSFLLKLSSMCRPIPLVFLITYAYGQNVSLCSQESVTTRKFLLDTLLGGHDKAIVPSIHAVNVHVELTIQVSLKTISFSRDTIAF